MESSKGKRIIYVPPIPPGCPDSERGRYMVQPSSSFFDVEIRPEEECHRPPAGLTFEPDSASVLYYTPQTVIDLSAPTCATRSEADMYHRLANARGDPLFEILDPATGIGDDEFKASIIKRYRDQVPQASFLKRHRESSETAVAERGSADGVLEASLLKRHCKEPGESSEIEVADLSSPTTGTADEVLGASVPHPYYEDLVGVK